jgi:TonB family protein
MMFSAHRFHVAIAFAVIATPAPSANADAVASTYAPSANVDTVAATYPVPRAAVLLWDSWFQDDQTKCRVYFSWLVFESSNYIWSGDCRDGKASGPGTLTIKYTDALGRSPNQVVATGTFVDGRMEGLGEVTLQDGVYVKGEFRSGKLNGRGDLKWPNGGRYEGEFVNGRFDGQGTVNWPSEGSYSGLFSGGIENGQGIYTFPDHRMIEGEFKGGNLLGLVIATAADGTRVEGNLEAPRVDYNIGGELAPSYYPSLSLRLNQAGTSIVRFTVATDETVHDAWILSPSGHQALDEAAIAAVSRWRMKPALLNGKPNELIVTKAFKFKFHCDADGCLPWVEVTTPTPPSP